MATLIRNGNVVGGTMATISKEDNNAIEKKDDGLFVNLSGYVKKDGSKVLSTNDYTDTDKAEVEKVKDKADKTDAEKIVETTMNFIPNVWLNIDGSYTSTLDYIVSPQIDISKYNGLIWKNYIRSIGDRVLWIYNENDDIIDYWSPSEDERYISLSDDAKYIRATFKSNCDKYDGIFVGEECIYHPERDLVKKVLSNTLHTHELNLLGYSVPDECPIQNAIVGNNLQVNVGRVELGGLEYKLGNPPNVFRTKSYIYDIVNYSDEYNIDNIYCKQYSTKAYHYVWIQGEGISLYDHNGLIAIHDNNFTDPNLLKSSLRGVYLYYELATPYTLSLETEKSPVSDEYDSGKSYNAGDYCIYNNELYKALLNSVGVIPTNGTYWRKTSVGEELSGKSEHIRETQRNINAHQVSLGIANAWSCGIVITNINGYGNIMCQFNFQGAYTSTITNMVGDASPILLVIESDRYVLKCADFTIRDAMLIC